MMYQKYGIATLYLYNLKNDIDFYHKTTHFLIIC